jgi:UDP-2,3-diacylglucosamine pyrophosphatase LpxH
MQEPVRIVISDLHLGQNDAFDIFSSPDKPRLFADFLAYLAGSAAPVELVINGDLVDFLQLQPWSDLSRVAAAEKMRHIVEGSRHVFAALGQFLRDGRHAIKVLLGNHDVELAYPEVWDLTRQAILAQAPGAVGRLELFSKRTTYNPQVNGVTVHIEHGNAGDRWNEINYVPLFQDIETGTHTFAYPQGTKLVYETMNGFKESYQFVDVLKPEMPAVPLILLALKPQAGVRAIPDLTLHTLKSWGQGLAAGLRRRLAGLPFAAPGRLLVEEVLPETLAEGYSRLAAAGIGLAPSEAEDLTAFLSKPGGPDDATLVNFAASGNPVQLKLLVSALQTLNRFRAAQQGEAFYTANHHDDVSAVYARRNWLKGDVKVVIFGHTHEALTATFPEGIYVNSGAWANLVKLPSGTATVPLQQWFAGLADNTFERTSFPTFVRLAPEGDGMMVSLNAWTLSGEKKLWQRDVRKGA